MREGFGVSGIGYAKQVARCVTMRASGAGPAIVPAL
jgi:hypothetical protein